MSHRGTGSPARPSNVLTRMLAETERGGRARASRKGDAKELERPYHCGLEQCDAVDPFAQVEDEIQLRLADALDPTAVRIGGDADHLMTVCGKYALDGFYRFENQQIRGLAEC